MPRIYLAQPLTTNSSITLPQDIAHRLQHVLRLGCDDELVVFNGEGGEFQAKIATINKKQINVDILEWQAGIAESPLIIHLGQGIARGEKMDFIIQKAVELGANFITPLFTEFCNVKLEGERLQQRLQHWQKVAVHACEQSGRCHVPRILPAQAFSQWMDTITDYLRIILSPEAESGLYKISVTHTQKIALLVGSEGGISSNETAAAIAQGFYACRLGPRILRTETAALVALSILQAKFGDF